MCYCFRFYFLLFFILHDEAVLLIKSPLWSPCLSFYAVCLMGGVCSWCILLHSLVYLLLPFWESIRQETLKANKFSDFVLNGCLFLTFSCLIAICCIFFFHFSITASSCSIGYSKRTKCS